MAPDPSPPAPPVDLRAVTSVLVEHVACDPDLAVRIGSSDARDRHQQVADLLRCATSAGSRAAGPAVAPPPGLDLDHRAFSLLASHLADVLDALGVDEVAAADLLAGLHAVRRRVVRPLP
jgi:hypothetical protein